MLLMILSQEGLPVPSNASKEWSGTIRDLRRKREKLEKKVKELVEEQVGVDKKDNDEEGRRSSGGAERKGQIERLLQKAERIERWLGENRPRVGRQGETVEKPIPYPCLPVPAV